MCGNGYISTQYVGHSSHVTNVRWTNAPHPDSHLITVGGNDRCVFQWECFGETDDAQAPVVEAKVDVDSEDERLLAVRFFNMLFFGSYYVGYLCA